MGLYENIKNAAEMRHSNIHQIEKELSLPRSSIAKYNSHVPSVDKIAIIANFLGVSVDFLLYGHEKVTKSFPLSKGYDITPFEYEIIMAYRAADEYDKTSIVRTLKLEEKKERGTGTA